MKKSNFEAASLAEQVHVDSEMLLTEVLGALILVEVVAMTTSKKRQPSGKTLMLALNSTGS